MRAYSAEIPKRQIISTKFPLKYIANADKYPLDDTKANADVYNPGDGITGKDANSIMKFDAGELKSLPETLS